MPGYAALERVRRIDVHVAWADPVPPTRWSASAVQEPSAALLELSDDADRASVRVSLGDRIADCREILVQTTFFLMDRDNSWL